MNLYFYLCNHLVIILKKIADSIFRAIVYHKIATMNRFISIFFCIFFSLKGLSQIAPAIQWQKTLGGTNADNAGCIKQTKDGGYILAGNTKSNDSDVNGNHGDWDMWIVKMNNVGGVQWKKCYGGSNTDESTYIEQTTDGGYIIAGATNSNNGDVSGYYNGNTASYLDAWILKIDSLGTVQWQKCYGGSNFDAVYEIHQTFDGGYIAVGETDSDDGIVVGQHAVTIADVWVLKIDSIGNLQWQKCLGGTNQDYGQSIIQTIDSGYLIAGETYSTDGDVVGNHGDFDGWVVKLNSKGKLIWNKCYGGSGGEYIYSIIQNKDKSFTFCGSTAGSNNGDLTGITTYGGGDDWVMKIDSIGKIIWQKCYGGSKSDYAYSLEQTSDGGFIIIGTTESDSVMGNKPNNFHGLNDYWMVRIDSIGNLVWQTSIGGIHDDDGFSILQTSDGGYLVFGDAGSSDGDVLKHYGQFALLDCWLVKLMPDILPLSILSFKASPTPPKEGLISVMLNWVTTDEVNVSHFNLQRSVNSKDFNTIGNVEAIGTDNKHEIYSYIDQAPPPPNGRISYYRLEIVDRDGKKTYSEIREVELSIKNYVLRISPNPARDYVRIETNKIKEITILNSSGQTVVKQEVNLPITKVSLQKLAKGIYYVKTVNVDGMLSSSTLLKE